MYKCYTLKVDSGDWFDWDESNEDHVLAHGVEPAEVEEALLDPEGLGTDAYDVPGEQREALVGATEEGVHPVRSLRDTWREGSPDNG
jgi:uncharacterized DUF497 family protein